MTAPVAYVQGLHDLGNGHYAYLQPDESWGLSDAGLVTDAGQRCSSTRSSICG